MTMPHKICPQCGQPAVLAMTQCRRCGFVYGSSTPTTPTHFPTAPNSAETPRAQQAALQTRNPVLLALLLLLGLGVCLLGAALQVWRHAAHRPSGGSALSSAPSDTASSPGKLSLFVESESAQEMPVLTFRNFAPGAMTLTLRDRYGHVYRASSSQAEMATLQVPAGDYSVSIDSDNPLIRPNWGDATFRKFKAYDANFIVGHSDRRVHLGD